MPLHAPVTRRTAQGPDEHGGKAPDPHRGGKIRRVGVRTPATPRSASRNAHGRPLRRSVLHADHPVELLYHSSIQPGALSQFLQVLDLGLGIDLDGK